MALLSQNGQVSSAAQAVPDTEARREHDGPLNYTGRFPSGVAISQCAKSSEGQRSVLGRPV